MRCKLLPPFLLLLTTAAPLAAAPPAASPRPTASPSPTASPHPTASPSPAAIPAPAAVSAAASELPQIAQTLLDAVTAGDRAVWAARMADDCLITAEDGRSLDKKGFLKGLAPLPSGYAGKLVLRDPQVRERGGAAVVSYVIDEALTLYGQTIHTTFHTTDTYVRTGTGADARWQLLASQTLRQIAEPPVGATPDAHALEEYAGTYVIGPDASYTVTVENGKLYSQRNGRPKKDEMLPEVRDVFFRRGAAGRRIFLRDAAGKVNRLVDRRDGDLVWTRQ